MEQSIGQPMEKDLNQELDLLEEKVQQAAQALERLRAQNKSLEDECARLRGERGETIKRVSRILEKVDSLGGG